jgi:Ca-activated chloride channel family protein
MDWSQPQLLWLILPLSFAWLGLALFARSRRRRAIEAFVAAGMRPRIMPADSPVRFWIKTLLWEAGLICGIIALAGPRFGTYFEYVKPRGADLYIAIDVSRSMLATDVLPSRLGRAKADVADLLQHLNGERVALLAFAGRAAVRCPLTTDYGYFRKELNDLDTTSAPRGGTAIGDAIRKALEVLPQDPSRDQAILLITDGEDHESRPEKAAETAAERRVAIFTVGLGDAADGALVPKAKDDNAFMEYKGQQIRSKLDNKVLEKIALLSGGAHIPAGTQQYNLGELYENRLKQLRAGNTKEEKRQRLSEQYQIFLGLSLLAFLLELLVSPYSRPVSEAVAQLSAPAPRQKEPATRRKRNPAAVSLLLLLAFLGWPIGRTSAEEPKVPAPEAKDTPKDTPPAKTEKPDDTPPYDGSPRSAVNEGLAAYRDDKFDVARQRFAQASALLKKDDRENLDAAIAAFDLACALHRKDSREQAQSEYLTASLSRDKELAAAAHYNLGCLTAEQARNVAGEDPLKLEPAKRTEVVEKLKEAAQSFRRCLDVAPNHADARRNLELARQWVKYWSDKWRELDREKRRKESPLLEYLEYLIATEKALHEEVRHYKSTTPLDALMEARRLQTEIHEEIEPFQDRMKDELAPRQELSTPGIPGTQPPQLSEEEKKKKEEADKRQAEALKMLLNWVATAGQKMKSASEYLSTRKPKSAATDQKAAADQLESVWEALVPFHPLLDRELTDQTAISGALAPEPPPPPSDEKGPPQTTRPKEAESRTFTDEELAKLVDLQQTAARRAMLLKLKADQELKEVERMPPPQAQPAQPGGPTVDQPGQPDPEKLKEGYQKAVELAPKAMEKMTSAADLLREKQPARAYPDAEEARKILDEIAKAFKQEQPPDQDQQKKDQQDQKKQEKKDEQKQNEEQQKEQKEQQMSRDRMEAMLRQVREREKLKEQRDKELKAYLMGSDDKVEKDW